MRPVSIMSIMRAVPMRCGRRTAAALGLERARQFYVEAACGFTHAILAARVSATVVFDSSCAGLTRASIGKKHFIQEDGLPGQGPAMTGLQVAAAAVGKSLSCVSMTLLRKPVKRSQNLVD